MSNVIFDKAEYSKFVNSYVFAWGLQLDDQTIEGIANAAYTMAGRDLDWATDREQLDEVRNAIESHMDTINVLADEEGNLPSDDNVLCF